jgi:hypothetical protein
MGTFLSGNQFTVSFPYYGLFREANVQLHQAGGEPLFECRLLNGAILWLKRMGTRRWVDAESNSETALSSVIGMYIEDLIKE